MLKVFVSNQNNFCPFLLQAKVKNKVTEKSDIVKAGEKVKYTCEV